MNDKPDIDEMNGKNVNNEEYSISQNQQYRQAVQADPIEQITL